jgi:hypothetical protein
MSAPFILRYLYRIWLLRKAASVSKGDRSQRRSHGVFPAAARRHAISHRGPLNRMLDGAKTVPSDPERAPLLFHSEAKRSDDPQNERHRKCESHDMTPPSPPSRCLVVTGSETAEAEDISKVGMCQVVERDGERRQGKRDERRVSAWPSESRIGTRLFRVARAASTYALIVTATRSGLNDQTNSTRTTDSITSISTVNVTVHQATQNI